MNAIKDAIKSGRTVVGTTVTPNVDVSILADAGYDFLLFDTQHSAWEIKQLQYLPVTYVSRDFEGLVDVTVAGPQFETEKEPLSLTLRAERNHRNVAPRRGSPNRLPIRLR